MGNITNKADLGKVAITVANAPWNANTYYEKLTQVFYDGDSYVSLVNNRGVNPKDNPNTWAKSTAHGKSLYELLKDKGLYDGTEEEFVNEWNQRAIDIDADIERFKNANTEFEGIKTIVQNTVDNAQTAIHEAGAATNLATTAATNVTAATNRANLAAEKAEGIKQSLDNFIAQGGGATDAQVILNTEDLRKLKPEVDTLGPEVGNIKTELNGESEVSEDKTFVIPSVGNTMSITNKQTISLIAGKHYRISCNEALSSGYLYFFDNISSSAEIERVSIGTLLADGYTPSQNVGAITIYNSSSATSHDVVFTFTTAVSGGGLKDVVTELKTKVATAESDIVSVKDTADKSAKALSSFTDAEENVGYNLFNPSDEKLWNGYIKSNGDISETTPYDGTATYFTTGYIEVEAGKRYYNAPTNKSYYGSRFLMYYDTNKSPITDSYNSTDQTASSVAPANAKYLRVSIATRYFNECQITEGQQREYEPYVEPSVVARIKGEMIKDKSIGKNALSDDIDLGGRNKMYIYLSDSEEEIFLKLRQAIEQKDTDVYWEKGTYTFSSIFDLMATKYAPMQSYELPVGGNCRYYFNGATLRGIYPVGSDFNDASRNLMGSARVASDYELHDGFLYAEGLRYVFHDETNGSAEQYRRLYHNMHFSRKWAKPDVSSALEKIIGGGTGEWGIVEFDGCTFKADSNKKMYVTYHGLTKNTTVYSRFQCVIKNCYIDGTLNFYDAAGYSTNQHWDLIVCNNAIRTFGKSSINDKFNVVEFGNEVIQ